jgi:hypothetical protein
VAYSGEGAILGWTLLNVDNPDLAILLPDALNPAELLNRRILPGAPHT